MKICEDDKPASSGCGPSDSAVTLYSGENYTGTATKVKGPGRWDANANRQGSQLHTTGYVNDSAKSIKIEPGFKVTVYQHDIGNTLYSGNSTVLTNSTPSLSYLGGLSSLVVEQTCGTPGHVPTPSCPTKCTYGPMANTNIVMPECPSTYRYDPTIGAPGRCGQASLTIAQSLCDKLPNCTGVTLDPQIGYEPRNGNRKLGGTWGAMYGAAQGFQRWPGLTSWNKSCAPDPNCGVTPAPSTKCTYGSPTENKFNVNPKYCPPGAKNYDPNNGQELNTVESDTGQTRCSQMTFEAAKALCDTSSECLGVNAGHRSGGTAWGYEPYGSKSWAGLPGESKVRAAYGVNQGMVSAAGTRNWAKISCGNKIETFIGNTSIGQSFTGDIAWLHGFRNYINSDDILSAELYQTWKSRWPSSSNIVETPTPAKIIKPQVIYD
jgi:hypothetical protein